jgi:subtilisin family serine protease
VPRSNAPDHAPNNALLELRTGIISADDARISFTNTILGHRRTLRAVFGEHASDAVPTKSSDWGFLKDSRQVLVGSHLSDSAELLDHLESHGCRVGSRFGDGAMLVFGPAAALEKGLQHSHVSWVAHYEPKHKVAPEWDFILESLHSMKNISTSSPLDVVFSELGEPLFGVRAVFPSTHRPRLHNPSHERHDIQHERVKMYDKDALRSSGFAAVKDWARAIEGEFSVAHLESNGRDAVKLYVLRDDIDRAIHWLSRRDVVHWIEPAPRMMMMNRQASSITQSGEPLPYSNRQTNIMPDYHPFWSAGLTGKGMVIGIGDSGLDYKHCFFADPDTPWEANIVTIGRVLTFSSETHRKIRLYRAFADFRDDNGHGTHTCGTLAGMPYGNTVAEASLENIGMAPEAKLAFIDLSSVRDGERIVTPGDLANEYFRYTTDVGATVHSDSWGSTNIFYDYEARQIDEFCWENPTFLPVFPAGNDGSRATYGGNSGQSTVNSPATAKNCLAVGATETAGTRANFANTYTTFTGTIYINGIKSTSFPVLLSSFSPDFTDMPTTESVLAIVEPVDACSPIQNAANVVGKVALIERGSCEFILKAKYAEQAGAAGVVIYDNVAGAYFTPDASGDAVNIPVGFVPRRIGQNLVASMGTGQTIAISFGPGTRRDIGYENQASFSSQGPVNPDRRVKPDIVAPGIVDSAAAGTGCSTTYFSGTSMATPVVAGNAALIQQYFKEGFYPTGFSVPENAFMPTSSLVKAVMMGGAKQITGYEADTGLPIDPAPSFRQGYGRVFLGGSLQLQDNPYNPKMVQILNSVDIVDKQKHVYCITSTGGPLSVTVAWTDLPGNPNSRRTLVNNIDLVVRAEGFNGMAMLGNGGDIDDSSKADDVNNVEQVRLDYLPAGRVSIEIYGAEIYSNGLGPQSYSLVINGEFEGALVAPVQGQSQEECPVLSAVITSGPAKLTNDDVVTFEFGIGGSSAGFEFQCMMEIIRDGQPVEGSWADCSSPAQYADLPDGEYVFSVKPTLESTVAKMNFVVDRTPPILQVSQVDAPRGLAKFQITATDSSKVSTECMIELGGDQGIIWSGEVIASPVKPGEWYECDADVTFGWLQPGQAMFYSRAIDLVGNVSPTDAKAISVPSDQRFAYIKSGPFLTIPKSEVEFSITSEPSQEFECDLLTWASDLQSPGAPQQWNLCSSNPNFGVLKDGKYSFFAKTMGAPDELAASSTFTVDEIAPTIEMVSAPRFTIQPEARFEFEVSEKGVITQCKLTSIQMPEESTDWAPCEQPVLYRNLTGGRYIFEIVATDAVGNRGEPNSFEFVVDTSPPTVTVDYPEGTREPTMTVTFVAEDGVDGSGIANTTCRITPVKLVGKQVDENSQWMPALCQSPWTFDLEEGEWELSIVATDNAGLSSIGQPIRVWMDTIPPTPYILSGPSNDTVNPGGTVVFNISDGTQDLGGSPVLWQGYLSLISSSIEYQPIETSESSDSPSIMRIKSTKSSDAEPLGQSSLNSWANCSTTSCVYEGLGTGTYSFITKGVDAAGNTGEPSQPYSFRLEGAKGGLPTWALIVIIVGSCVLGVLLLGTIWCCCRKPTARKGNGYSTGAYAMHSHAVAPQTSGPLGYSSFQSGYPNGFQQGYQSDIPGGRSLAGSINGLRYPDDPVQAQAQALKQYGATVNEEEELRLAMAMSLADAEDHRRRFN